MSKKAAYKPSTPVVTLNKEVIDAPAIPVVTLEKEVIEAVVLPVVVPTVFPADNVNIVVTEAEITPLVEEISVSTTVTSAPPAEILPVRHDNDLTHYRPSAGMPS